MWDVGAECWKQDIQFANKNMRKFLDKQTERTNEGSPRGTVQLSSFAVQSATG
jgi:hypothetical protein